MTRPFTGTRIIDFTQGIAGPMATMLFADFGADVVKVEPPAGDRMKDAPGYLAWNRNKRRVTLDLHTFDGRRQARELIAGAELAVFDNHPGELERLGLDATTVLAEAPATIHAWMPPYGTAGRWSQLPQDDLLLSAVSGVADLQLSFEERPVALVTPQISYGHATIAANGMAAALWERRQTGAGQALVISGLHGVSSVEGGGAINAPGLVRLGARGSLGGAPHYRLYRCADNEWFFLGCLIAPFFLKALEAIDLLEVMTLPGVEGEFLNLMRNPEASRAAQAMLEARFAERPRDHWMRILGDAGVPKGPAGIREEWFREETVRVNEMLVALEHPKLGRVEMPGIPVKLADPPGAIGHLLAEATAAELIAEREPLPAPATAPPMGRRPLEGVRVIDLGQFIAGTFAPTVLANYGADVIKVEQLEGDPFRSYGLSSYGHNFGKRSIALDLKHAAGRAVFDELVRRADVVLDNYRLGVRERLGVDYASLKTINPRIITCSVTGYGPVGPLAQDPGFDPLLQARSGMMRAQGGADEPVFHQIAVNDTATAMMAAFGIQAALHARELTGRGQEVHTCLANQTILFQSGELTWYEGRPASPLGGRDCVGTSALHRFYQCADGWLAIACTTAAQFHALAVGLGHPEWAGRTIAEKALAEPRDGLLAEGIAECLAAMPRAEALDRLLAKGVPAAPSRVVGELFDDPWLRENAFFQEIDDPQWGAMTAIRTYADWGRSLGGFPRRTPLLGEHTSEVLHELGYDDARIAELLASGAVAGE